MATIYFSNTADSGDGSLRKALELATADDIIAPDPTVFHPGEHITINIQTYLPITKSATLVAGNVRPRIVSASGITLYARTGGTFLHVDGYEIVGRTLAYFPESSFTRCLFAGNAETAHLVQGSSGASISLTDCLVVGSKRSGIYTTGAGSSLTLTRTTVAGCVRPCSIGSSTTFTSIDSIVDPVSSEAGFVAPPPDDLSIYTGALPWEEWNLALLPTSQYATGATTAAGQHDFIGLPRGRVVNGTTVYAIGAYEVVEADYYYAGPEGEFNDASNWRTTRGGSIAPNSISAGTFFVDQNVTWIDSPPDGSTLIVAGFCSETFSANAKFAHLEIGIGAEIVLAGTDRILYSQSIATGADFSLTSATRGYFTIPTNVDVSGIAVTNVVVCEYGAGITSFNAVATGSDEVTLSWTQNSSNKTVLLEVETPTGWETITQSSAGEYVVTITRTGVLNYRAFDGETFFEDAAWTAGGGQYKAVCMTVGGLENEDEWTVVSEVVDVDGLIRAGQSITLLARIYDAFDEETPLLNDGSNITSVTYTLEKRSKSLFDYEWTPVTGHNNVNAGTSCVLETLQTSDAWTADETGYSFALTPDTTTYTLFPEPGTYRFKITVTLEEGNPVVFYETITVVEN